MARIPHAAAQKNRPERRLRNYSRRNIAWEFALIRKSIHLSKLERRRRINLLSDKRWQGEKVVQISCAKCVILIAEQLIRAVSAEPSRASQKILGNAGMAEPKCAP